MNCEVCHRGPQQGIALFRVNALGELPPRWRCDHHMDSIQRAAVDPDVRRIAEIIQHNKPMPDTERIAGELYEAYSVAVGGKAWNGDPLPDWKTFRADPAKRKQSDAWVKVAEVAAQICR